VLHRVLALDARQFYCFLTWEIVFPAAIQKRFLAGVGAVDRLLGGPGMWLLNRLPRPESLDYDKMHELGLFLPEEDEHLMMHILEAPFWAVYFPYMGFDRFNFFDREIPPRERRRVMAYYRRCVQRQAWHRSARGRSLLSKNPYFSGKVRSLVDEFPDARFLYLVRNPLDVVPSTISFIRAIVRQTFHKEADGDLDQKVFETIAWYYDDTLQALENLPPDRWQIVRYDDMLRDPEGTVRAIYERFGLTLGPEYAERLAQEAARMRQHKSKHKYSLDASRIAPEQIVAAFGHIFRRFAFDTRGVTPAEPEPAPSVDPADVTPTDVLPTVVAR
jgi:hypothetical protein